jgi:hypothetical protein
MTEIYVVRNKLSNEVHYFHPDLYTVENQTIDHVDAGKTKSKQTNGVHTIKKASPQSAYVEDLTCDEDFYTLKTINPLRT